MVRGQDGPDLGALARRIAARVADGVPQGEVEVPEVRGGFGARQRATLVRLRWPVPPGGQALYLVARSTFLSAEEVAGWATGPPEDAIELPAGTDGLVDARPEPGRTTFYAVLAGGRSLPLAPDPPPFGGASAPWLLGDVEEALERGLAPWLRITAPTEAADAPRPVDLPPRLKLARAAVQILPEDAELRARLERLLEAWRRDQAEEDAR